MKLDCSDLKILVDGLEHLGILEVKGNLVRFTKEFREELVMQLVSTLEDESLTPEKRLTLSVTNVILARGGYMDLDSLVKYIIIVFMIMKKTYKGVIPILIDNIFSGGFRK